MTPNDKDQKRKEANRIRQSNFRKNKVKIKKATDALVASVSTTNDGLAGHSARVKPCEVSHRQS